MKERNTIMAKNPENNPQSSKYESMLRGLATSDSQTIESLLAIQLDNLEKSGLDPKSYWLSRIAALIAIDAPPASFIWNIQMALQMGITSDDIVGVLIALAPTVGIARIVSAAPEIAFALDIHIAPEQGEQPQQKAA
jgi:alkylhydroperoxidase/carboxymuconolactone decarboxylase family protein YurZ